MNSFKFTFKYVVKASYFSYRDSVLKCICHSRKCTAIFWDWRCLNSLWSFCIVITAAFWRFMSVNKIKLQLQFNSIAVCYIQPNWCGFCHPPCGLKQFRPLILKFLKSDLKQPLKFRLVTLRSLWRLFYFVNDILNSVSFKQPNGSPYLSCLGLLIIRPRLHQQTQAIILSIYIFCNNFFRNLDVLEKPSSCDISVLSLFFFFLNDVL